VNRKLTISVSIHTNQRMGLPEHAEQAERQVMNTADETLNET
jgi:hypothetical protein